MHMRDQRVNVIQILGTLDFFNLINLLVFTIVVDIFNLVFSEQNFCLLDAYKRV